MRHYVIILLLSIFTAFTASAANNKPLVIGSKAFMESHILAEIAAQLLEHNGIPVKRELGLGGTLIVYEALKQGSIDIYPEYTGTIATAILKQSETSQESIRASLAHHKLALLAPLGFNNSYAIAMSKELAQQYNIKNISDLNQYPQLRWALSLEFLKRQDGWPSLQQHYQLTNSVSGIEHALAYAAIQQNKLDVTDAYTTDGELEQYKLALLHDDRDFFPAYHAAYLVQEDLPMPVVNLLDQLAGRITDDQMRNLNYLATQPNHTPASVARHFLLTEKLIAPNSDVGTNADTSTFDHTLQHLYLTLFALVTACLSAVPLALLTYQNQKLSRFVVYSTGLLQTIPSLALLALMIPLFGLGETPAIIALFLYSLLPIVRNTLNGLNNIDPLLKQVADGLGLSPKQRLWKIELPLAIPSILAGIKTAAIINIGTATLAAFVGAGGLGEPIITGLTLNDHQLVLQGAIPAALLALTTEFIFEIIDKKLLPAHLRRK
ncbi:glycine betaine ABC transporter substrate-binding protein [Pleionea sp. CnH1-48]|uniref:glycine betaine ABC transporter substrate-binding protein n=1 Tax=Pleionea sp. CnH1-48 TaxID=2954494 RepID=UPI00209720C7|nr:glycine betaine ABC transporter substrate-binding protein [Pleionea sp. CnH1-48]MCO7225105.1 ABC transporter permease subunit [Pleionea sp. CnH1-48]